MQSSTASTYLAPVPATTATTPTTTEAGGAESVSSDGPVLRRSWLHDGGGRTGCLCFAVTKCGRAAAGGGVGGVPAPPPLQSC